MMRGTVLTGGADTYWFTELEAVAEQVQAAVMSLRDRYEAGEHGKNLHEPFIAHHLHVIRGDRAYQHGEPMPPKAKCLILGLTLRTYYRRIEDATEYVHDFITLPNAA
ncbi:MAG: hypothetical protein AAGJ50_13525 [Pseudomonadota bacterium]